MGKQNSILMLVCVAALLCQTLVIVPVMARTIDDQKNYYPSPDPHAGSPPTGSHTNHHHTPPGGSYGGTPPTHTTPSTPPHENCGTPPKVPTPSIPPTEPTPSIPSYPPPRGGGYYPSPPSSGGSPPTPIYVTPPTPTTPTPTPTTPYVPSPPFIPDPNSPFTCNYWRNHPGIIWGLLGWWGTVGNAFGATSLPGFGASMSLPQALSNTRNDGYGTLYREGTASLLNSMVSNRFPFTTRQVRESFMTALASNKAAAAQGQLFKLANEGKLKPRN